VRLLGIDIGEARVGIAVSDPDATVATPLTVLDGRSLASDIAPLARLVEDYEVSTVVVGLPLTLAGEEGPQAREVRRRAASLEQALRIPVVMWDERLTTAQARRSLSEAGLDGRAARKAVDMVAAALILQSYLDSHTADLRPRSSGEDT
jgi:putative Holliday junction resolvase